MLSTITTESSPTHRWNVLVVTDHRRTVAFWLCGAPAHPWHVEMNATWPTHGAPLVLHPQLESCMRKLLREDIVSFTKEVKHVMPLFRTLLGPAVLIKK